ncbi:MAG TPA: site-specific integrase [Candidatus Paceibacterota bacterium]|nr:site-specific integrase [Verrucomicrobiota bacterium]HRY51741.1 site-specific integrase [Candidatus Paceibacterota bacterium]
MNSWPVPPAVRQEVIRFLDDLALGKVNRGRRISVARQCHYIDLLRGPLVFLKKTASQIAAKDVERFERALARDIIRGHLRNRPFFEATKSDIRKAFKVYLRWCHGPAKAIELAGWLDTRVRAKTPDYLTESQAERLLKHCRSPEQRYVIVMLFDSGARAEEFINIRLEDVLVPEAGGGNYVKVALKQEYSKTIGRTISLYWRHSLEIIRDFVSERIASGAKGDDPVFPKTYHGLRMFLRRLGKRALGKEVHPHLFRHSSATYYAAKLNRQELCYRYGWKFSSPMPDVYISRAGLENKDLDTKFTNQELGGLKDELVKLQQQTKIKDERINSLQENLNEMQKNLAMIAEVLAMKPTIREVERAVGRKKWLSQA